MTRTLAFALAVGLVPLAACSTDGAGRTVKSAASSVADGVSSVPSLVNVDLRNVLNDLAVRLNLDEANVPINAQIPITLALNVCGVSINVLAVSTGGQANCTAETSSPELAQVVQQQLAAGGSVGGGAQGGSTAANSGSTASGTAGMTGGSGTSGTSADSSGTPTGSSGTSTGSTAPASGAAMPTSGTSTTGTATSAAPTGSTSSTVGSGASGSSAQSAPIQ